MALKLNIGCGGAWRVDGWLGIDQRTTAGIWQQSEELHFLDLDVRNGLPFPTNSADVIFSSHALEHFTYEEGVALLFEMYRVLKVGAPLCLIVPDMDLYVSRFVDRDLEYMTTPEIVGGTPRGTLTDNFLMNFFSDPKFNNTCHKYSYNFENLSHRLWTVGFDEVERVEYHKFSYWPELESSEFRSPINHIERFSLCVQCRKLSYDPEYRTHPVYQEAVRYARVGVKDTAEQHINSLLILNEGLNWQKNQADLENARLREEAARQSELLRHVQSDLEHHRAALGNLVAEAEQLRAESAVLHVNEGSLQQAVAERTAEVARLQSETALRAAETERSKAEIHRLQADNQHQTTEISALTADLQNLTREVGEHKIRADRLSAEIVTLRTDLLREAEARGELQREVDRQNHLIADGNAQLDRLRKENSEIPRLRQALERKAQEISEQERGFGQRFAAVQEDNRLTVNALEVVLAAARPRNYNVAQRTPVSSASDVRPPVHHDKELRFVQRTAGSSGSRSGNVHSTSGALLRRLNYPALNEARKAIAAAGIFDERWYLATNPDVAGSGKDALTHYVLYGAAEGRDPHPLFDTDWYVSNQAELIDPDTNPLVHYIREGDRAGIDPHPLFDVIWYRSHYDTGGRTALAAYIQEGAAKGANPNPLFDGEWYARQYPEVATGAVNPLAHYAMNGSRTNPHPLFDTAWFLAQNRQLGNTNPLAHYLAYWREEAGDPHPLFDTKWYLSQNPDLGKSSPLAHYVHTGAANGRAPNPLFDPVWYAGRYGVSREQALVDYIRSGASGERDPHSLFDSRWYQDNYDDVRSAHIDPLIHYLHRGRQEGCRPNPLFDAEWYLSEYPEAASSSLPPPAHYALEGASKGYDPHPLFDTDWYLTSYPDVAAAGVNPLAHFLTASAAEGRCPTAAFDTPWYLLKYPTVAASGANVLVDYTRDHAAMSGERDPNPIFDGQWYVRQYPDVAQSGMNPLAHYVRYGWKEGRNPAPLFDTKWYVSLYPEVASGNLDPLSDYLKNGVSKRRNPSPDFDGEAYFKRNPDVAAARVNPLAHYVQHGKQRGSAISAAGTANTPETSQLKTTPTPLEVALKRSERNAAPVNEAGYSPLISILVPTWNTPTRYLNEVLNSVRGQTYPNWELCIVDDGSSQTETLRILERAATEDKRIRVAFREVNGGIAESSQQALEMATGEFVGFVDHDDVLAKNALAEVVRLLREDPSVDMVYTDHAMMSEEGTLESPELKPGWSPELFFSTNYVVHFKVLRRSMVTELGGFRDTIHSAQDIGLSCKVVNSNRRVRHLPGIYYYWRKHSTSVASGTRAKPAIETAAIATYNQALAKRNVHARVIWPDFFRSENVGAYKVEFSVESPRRVTVVIPSLLDSDVRFRSVLSQLRRSEQDVSVHVITRMPTGDIDDGFAAFHSARNQAEFDNIVAGLDTESIVFLSPTATLISAPWLRELTGYLDISEHIGAVGGKILNQDLCVQSGAMLLLDQITPLNAGLPDSGRGYWYNNLITSNVEAVSPRLLATRKSLYAECGGIPFFKYGDAAGTPFCLNLRKRHSRVVYNPWSKIVDTAPELIQPDVTALLTAEFGSKVLNDRYYHPFFSRTQLFTVETNP